MTDVLIEALLKNRRYAAQAAILMAQDHANRTVGEDPAPSRALALSPILTGEAASQMPEAFCDTRRRLAWNRARGLRHPIAHGYRTVVPDIRIETARDDLPQLGQIDALLKDAWT